MQIYLNGKIVPEEQAYVSVLDHGFLYGVGLFETMRVYRGRIFLWREHLSRLQAGLNALHIHALWSEEELHQAVLDTTAANGLEDAYVRMSITGGAEGVGLIAGDYEQPSLFIFAKPVAPIPEIPEPKKLQVLQLPRQTPEGFQRFKSHNYLNNVLAKQESGGASQLEGLFLTRAGYVAEGVVSNIFWVKDGILYTPSLETGILAGITRDFVITLASRIGLTCREGLYLLDELLQAEEVFVTNSIQEIVPVESIDQTIIAVSANGITAKLMEAYRQARQF